MLLILVSKKRVFLIPVFLEISVRISIMIKGGVFSERGLMFKNNRLRIVGRGL